MLTALSIQNYALINQLSIDFTNGLSIITGETGAGKSILLGALGLVLGNRADVTSLKDTSKKCVVEAQLTVAAYNLSAFFESLALDYEPQTIIRREILPSGKSRAFVNDTPVTLAILNKLQVKLIDVHSQHQTMELSGANFQFTVIDALAVNAQKIASYKRGLKQLNVFRKELQELEEKQREEQQQYDYNLHLYNELVVSKLKEDEQLYLEQSIEKLSNVEEIKLNLSEALSIAVNEDIGVQSLLHSIDNNLQKIAPFSKEYTTLSARIASVKIELDDVIIALENATENVASNPYELEELNARLQLIYGLQKKHYVTTIAELLVIQQELLEKTGRVENAEERISKQQQEIKQVSLKLDALAAKISKAREKVIPKLQKELEFLLTGLGMPNARFSINSVATDTYFSNGKDQLSFLFSANKGASFGELKKVASGGELSRIMLSIKKILSEHSQLPTILFDEIDTGVSGEVSTKIAAIMQEMSQHMQVITITHLPQIAAKGNQHYKVYKEDVNGVTTTNLKQLSEEERIVEIAEMLSGKNISDSAMIHARELLDSNCKLRNY